MIKKSLLPDFIIIPRQLMEDKDITPIDEKVYGIVYWLAKLKNEKCTASNRTIAEIIKTSSGTVANSLTKLENKKFIARLFMDTESKIRQEIIPLVAFGVSPTDERVSLGNDTPPSLGNEQKKTAEQKEEDIAANAAIRKDLISFYFRATEKKQGFKPEFDGGDGKALNIAIRKFKPEEIKDQINFYLNSEKATRNGVTLKAIFSTHSVNSWKQNGHKNKFI